MSWPVESTSCEVSVSVYCMFVSPPLHLSSACAHSPARVTAQTPLPHPSRAQVLPPGLKPPEVSHPAGEDGGAGGGRDIGEMCDAGEGVDAGEEGEEQ